MKRRDLLKSVPAMAALAQVPLTNTASPAVIPWAKFCDTEISRYDLATPWVREGWKIASTSRIVIRQRTDEPETTDLKKRVFGPNLLKSVPDRDPLKLLCVGKPLDIEREWQPYPESRPRRGWTHWCDECDSSGLTGPQIPCPELHLHNVAFDADFCIRCSGRNTIGTIVCPVCPDAPRDSARRMWIVCEQQVGRKTLGLQFDGLIRSLNEPIEFAEVDDYECGMLLFRGASFEGAVMSLCNKYVCGEVKGRCGSQAWGGAE